MIEELDARSASEARLRGLHLVESEADERTLGAPRPAEEALASYRSPGTVARRYWLATEDGEPAGAAFLSEYGASLVIGHVLVRPRFRRRGLGRALFGTLAEAARAGEVASFFGQHATEAGAAFAHAMGAVDDDRSILSVLELRTAELPAPSVPAGVELRSWIGATPDGLVESFVRARNGMRDAPVPGGLEMEPWTVELQRRDEGRFIEQGKPQHVTVALEHGEVVALTGIRVPEARGVEIAFTDDTATVPAARGRGLALAVKLESLRRLRDERPDVLRVATQNAAHNEAMLAVNRKVGFVPVLTLTSAVVTL